MRYLPDAAQMKAADQYTIQNLKTPSLTLMERAAMSCVNVMKEKNIDLTHVCVVCGSGNNGGDGFAIARLLANDGIKVSVYMVGNVEHCSKETLHQISLLKNIGVPIGNEYQHSEYSVIIDSVFGVGLNRDIEGHYFDVIDKINQEKAVKLAVDIPSGISADNGNVLGIAFQADYTVTFQVPKLGLLLYPGKEYTGELIVKDIGISEVYFENNQDVAKIFHNFDYQRFLPQRKEDSNKGTYGKLLVIAGSKGMSGAAYLNALSAYMVGAGLVQIYTTEDNRVILQQLLPEAIITTYDSYNEQEVLRLLKWADSICIGSGFGLSDISLKIIKTVITESDVPVVIDADGLNLLSKHMWYLEKKKHSDFIFTPHMKEMSRLTGKTINEIKENRKLIVNDFTTKYKLTCILKDSRTLIKCPDKRMVLNQSGNCAMAKAGSGDVLAGVIAGLLVQTKSCYSSAVFGTYLHGKCGDISRSEKGSYSVMARDLINSIPIVLKREEG